MKRILIFDDDVDILSICSYILEDAGWEVHTRDNCIDIVNTVRSISPTVILMDNWIPESGGMVATKSIKGEADLKDIPVIYFSANNDVQMLAKQAGADLFLEKPFDIGTLEKVLEKALKIG